MTQAPPEDHKGRALYRAEQVRELDRRVIASGVAGFALMQRAAASAWRYLRETWPEVRHLSVLCGGGNNGGDGHVLAALAAAEGFRFSVSSSSPWRRSRGMRAEPPRWPMPPASVVSHGRKAWC